jgi:hypothetical protein
MKLEDRIRMTAHGKVRVFITKRTRSARGFVVMGNDGSVCTLPSKRIALQFLLAIVRCYPARKFSITPAR